MKGTIQIKGRTVVLGDSREYRDLQRAIAMAAGDRDKAARNVCRLYGVRDLDALPSAIRVATLGPARSTAPVTTVNADLDGFSVLVVSR